MEQEWLSRKDAAKLLGVGPRTIDRWVSAGRLDARQLVPNGTVRISMFSIERLLKG
jgi:excisionase family DNA binding protein